MHRGEEVMEVELELAGERREVRNDGLVARERSEVRNDGLVTQTLVMTGGWPS